MWVSEMSVVSWPSDPAQAWPSSSTESFVTCSQQEQARRIPKAFPARGMRRSQLVLSVEKTRAQPRGRADGVSQTSGSAPVVWSGRRVCMRTWHGRP